MAAAQFPGSAIEPAQAGKSRKQYDLRNPYLAKRLVTDQCERCIVDDANRCQQNINAGGYPTSPPNNGARRMLTNEHLE